MTTLSERHFHLLMGVLVLTSSFLDREVSAWKPPQVSLVTMVLGLIWLGLFTAYRGRNLEDRVRVLEDRLERSDQRVKALDAELAELARDRRPLL